MITSQNDPNFVKNIKKEFLTFYGQLSYEEATDGKFYYKYDFMMDYRTAVKGKFEVYTKKYFDFFSFCKFILQQKSRGLADLNIILEFKNSK